MASRNPTRTPVESRGRRVPGLYERTTRSGRRTYEYVGRLNGRVRTVKLDADTKTDAIAEAETLRSGVRDKRIEISADRRKTVRDAVAEYLAHVEGLEGTKGAKSPRTIENIEDKLDLYVVPAIGHLPVAAVTDRDIEQLARSARHRSESTVRSILSTASQLFVWALRQRYCDHNPVKRAREIHGDTLLPLWTPKPQRALTDEEVLSALDRVGEAFRPVVAFTAETGLRISEVLALRWADADLDEGARRPVDEDEDHARDRDLRRRRGGPPRTPRTGDLLCACGHRRDRPRRARLPDTDRTPTVAAQRAASMARRARRDRDRRRRPAHAPTLVHRSARGARCQRGDRRRTRRPQSDHDDAGGLHADARRPRGEAGRPAGGAQDSVGVAWSNRAWSIARGTPCRSGPTSSPPAHVRGG